MLTAIDLNDQSRAAIAFKRKIHTLVDEYGIVEPHGPDFSLRHQQGEDFRRKSLR